MVIRIGNSLDTHLHEEIQLSPSFGIPQAFGEHVCVDACLFVKV